MIKTSIVLLLCAGGSEARRANVKKVLAEGSEVEQNLGGPDDDIQMMSMMSGSVKATGLSKSGKLSQKMASGVSSRMGAEGIQVFRASAKSALVSNLQSKSRAHASLREQVAFQTTLNFVSAGYQLDSPSEELIPLLMEEMETEMDSLNKEQGNCGRTSCKFLVCTYVGTTGQIDGTINEAVRTVDADGEKWAGRPVEELMTQRAGSIQSALTDLEEIDRDNIKIHPTSVNYGGVTRFAAVIMKVYGSREPPCEAADMNPLSAEKGARLAEVLSEKAASVKASGHGGPSMSGFPSGLDSDEDESDSLDWLDPSGGSQTGFPGM